MLHYVCRVEPNDAPFRKPRSDKPQLLRTACSAVAAKNIHARLKSITLCKHPFGRHWLAESHVPAAQRQLKAASRMDPAKCTTLFLVRHGETDWNVERRLQGHKDPHLNARGVLQAQQVRLSTPCGQFPCPPAAAFDPRHTTASRPTGKRLHKKMAPCCCSATPAVLPDTCAVCHLPAGSRACAPAL